MGVLQCFTCGKTFLVNQQASFQNHVYACQSKAAALRGGGGKARGRGGGGGGGRKLPQGVVEMRGSTIVFEKGGACSRTCNSCDEKVGGKSILCAGHSQVDM